jgi:hypothetical protein
MLKVMSVILLSLSTYSAFGQSATKYQVATITAVKPHQSAGDTRSDATSYDVSLRVGDTVYVVLYTPPLGMSTVNYAGGRELLVLVGKKTITYNDILAQSLEVPIVSRKPASGTKQSK